MNISDSCRGRESRRAVGDTVSFIPTAFINFRDAGSVLMLHGRVIYVNEAHRYFTVEAPCYGYKIRESFIF